MMDRNKADELPKLQVGFIDFVCTFVYKVGFFRVQQTAGRTWCISHSVEGNDNLQLKPGARFSSLLNKYPWDK